MFLGQTRARLSRNSSGSRKPPPSMRQVAGVSRTFTDLWSRGICIPGTWLESHRTVWVPLGVGIVASVSLGRPKAVHEEHFRGEHFQVTPPNIFWCAADSNCWNLDVCYNVRRVLEGQLIPGCVYPGQVPRHALPWNLRKDHADTSANAHCRRCRDMRSTAAPLLPTDHRPKSALPGSIE